MLVAALCFTFVFDKLNTHIQESGQRMLLLDIMRAVAVFMMIQGHTIDALLSYSFYNDNSLLFQIWQIGRGLTAPIFLFGSGFAYVIANTKKIVGGRMPLPLVWRRLRWIGLLYGIGAIMHFPVYDLPNLGAVSDEKWRIFFNIDVLRMMAVTLLGLLGVFLVARNLKQVFWISVSAIIAVIAISPVLDASASVAGLPLWISSYLTFKSGSFFPLFPFAGYLFAGAASASLFKMAGGENPTRFLVKRFALAGAVVLSITLLLRHVVFDGQGWVFMPTSPVFFAFRLSLVLLMWASVGTLIRKVKRLPRLIPIIGQHTLFIYVFHVSALYGGILVPGLRFIYGKELEFYPVFVVILTLVVVCTGMAYVLHDLKNYNIKAYRMAPYAGFLLFVGQMFL